MRDKLLIVISLVLGLGAAAAFYLFSGSGFPFGGEPEEVAAPAPVQTVKCVVLRQDVPKRTPLTQEMLGLVEIPLDVAHPQSVTEHDSAEGRITRRRLYKGEFLIESHLRDDSAPSNLSFVIPPGKRAITIGASVTSALSNMLKPGDRVDVIAYLDEKIAGSEMSVRILENMLVLATDAMIEEEEEADGLVEKAGGRAHNTKGYQSVTLAAKPEDCVRLNLAESVGRLKLALNTPRNENAGSHEFEVAGIKDLLRPEKETSVAVKKVSVRYVRRKPAPKKNETDIEITRDDAPKLTEIQKLVSIIRGTELERLTVTEIVPVKYSAK